MSVHRVNKRSKLRTALILRVFEVLLMEAARKSYPDPENPDNPMIAPRDYGNRT